MTDYHSHILPSVDDGSQSVEESLLLLRAEKEQGVKTVYATPHFYSQQRSLNDFLTKRAKAYEELLPHLTPDLPEVKLGAEVTFFSGMHRAEGLPALCLGESPYILIEMPKTVWGEREMRELITIQEMTQLNVVLAHIERYADYQRRNVVRELANNGIIMQMTASFLTNKKTRRYGLKMIKKELVHIIGSDCHNMSMRPPMIKEALEIVESELGKGVLRELEI